MPSSLSWDDSRVMMAVRRGATRAVVSIAYQVLEYATNSIMGTAKSGTVYRRRGVSHRASAPYEPPASDTGRLAASGRVIVPDQADLFEIKASVSWSTRYAPLLELGTARMAPRPYARPALAAIRPRLEPAVAAEIRKELG